MRLIFSSKQIPQLQSLSLVERIEKLDQAGKMLTLPEKLLLNILKLVILVPVFFLLLRVGQNWSVMLWMLLLLLCFPLLIKPLQYGLSEKYLSEVLKGSKQI
ncbi:DUF6170 family protein [Neptunicella sp. SCSIO 80796]|uniref:DUF6170 family protein n=1 Tax=Neptunicella plasticusilytica TaxID=3117012 RepID=UPI003A4E501E